MDFGNVHSLDSQIGYEQDYLPQFLHDHLSVDYDGSCILLLYLLHRHYFQHRCGQDWQIHSVQDFDGDYQNGH